MTDPIPMSGTGWEGCWLSTENRLMNVVDMDNFDPADFVGDGEDEESLLRNGEMPIGSVYVDYLDGSGVVEGGCFLYWPDQDLREWCEGNGYPVPMAPMPQQAWDDVLDFYYYTE